MAFLLHRLDVSAVESVDHLAQMEQIAEPAEVVDTTSHRPLAFALPARRSNRSSRPESASATVRQDHENEEDAAPPDAADRGKRLAFEGVALAGDGQRIWNITVMGSLWPLPSMPWPTHGLSVSSSTASRTSASCASLQKWLQVGTVEDGAEHVAYVALARRGDLTVWRTSTCNYAFDLMDPSLAPHQGVGRQ